MVQALDLGGTWRVTWSDGVHGPTDQPQFDPADLERYLEVPVPRELHLALGELGLAPTDLNFGTATLQARWIEEQYWQYHTTFEAPAEACAADAAWLVFDQLDLVAHAYLNGQPLGVHRNAHTPARLAARGLLRPGRNELVVTLDSGLHDVADRPGGCYHPGLDTRLNKRMWQRKAQYQFGWDWNPRLVNIGITGPVRLEWAERARLDQVAAWAEPDAEFKTAEVTIRAFIEGLGEDSAGGDAGAREATLRVEIAETGQACAVPVTLSPGLQCCSATLTLDRPDLWWPAGHGAQALYTARVTLEGPGGEPLGTATRRFGVRRVELERTPLAEGETFIVRVNGRRIFCKGGNWVPPELITSRIDRARCRALVELALAANFNLLRIWGGGVYAGHDLLDLCDEAGLLVWHDLLFACAQYPADDPAFLAAIRAEVTWAAREFAHHASLAVWCGNNELEWGYWDWNFDKLGKSLVDHSLYHLAIPRVLREEDPARPYWPSSPYSPGHEHPNAPTVGDQHPWGVWIQGDGTDFWAYRRRIDRFPNEGGVFGASSPATLRQFLPEGQRRMRSFAWEHHDNAVNFMDGRAGVAARAIEDWLGRDARAMEFDEYAFASALLQAEGLGEYVTNFRRRMFDSASAIFWMYNDSWPVTHGWTIVDYYLRKKLAFHPVRRAFAPVTVVVAEDGERIGIYGVNDSPEPWSGEAQWGLFGMAGGRPIDQARAVELPANAATRLAEFDRTVWERLGLACHGAFARLTREGRLVAQHRLLLERFKGLAWAEPKIAFRREPDSQAPARAGGERLLIESPVFVWGAALDLDGESALADNAFDLLPGLPYEIPWCADLGDPRILLTGNALLLG